MALTEEGKTNVKFTLVLVVFAAVVGFGVIGLLDLLTLSRILPLPLP